MRTISQAVSEIRYFLADIRTQYYDEEFGKGRWYQMRWEPNKCADRFLVFAMKTVERRDK